MNNVKQLKTIDSPSVQSIEEHQERMNENSTCPNRYFDH